MAKQPERKLNWLEKHLPEGLLVDSGWLAKAGYSTSLRSQYVKAGWLEQLVRQVYRRPRGRLDWQQVVVSLQTLLQYPLTVGGRTALELQGYAHYLSHHEREVHLYGPKAPPGWLKKLSVPVRFVYHNDRALFHHSSIEAPRSLTQASDYPADDNAVVQSWGQWNWPLTLSSPERAILELLNELPSRESFEQVDKLFQGLSNLSPRRLQKLLGDCHSIKVKRLFFFFADRHRHAWLSRLDRGTVDLGKGKRMLVKGGKLDHTHQITVPEDLDAVS